MFIIDKKNKIDIISFSVNKINALITEEIKEGINKVFETSNSKVIIDLKGVEYMDSSGFGCFLSILRVSRSNYGTLKFANPEPNVKEVIHTLNLDTVFQIYDNIDECIRSFS